MSCPCPRQQPLHARETKHASERTQTSVASRSLDLEAASSRSVFLRRPSMVSSRFKSSCSSAVAFALYCPASRRTRSSSVSCSVVEKPAHALSAVSPRERWLGRGNGTKVEGWRAQRPFLAIARAATALVPSPAPAPPLRSPPSRTSVLVWATCPTPLLVWATTSPARPRRKL